MLSDRLSFTIFMSIKLPSQFKFAHWAVYPANCRSRTVGEFEPLASSRGVRAEFARVCGERQFAGYRILPLIVIYGQLNFHCDL